jgi:hypothetical protein
MPEYSSSLLTGSDLMFVSVPLTLLDSLAGLVTVSATCYCLSKANLLSAAQTHFLVLCGSQSSWLMISQKASPINPYYQSPR